MNVKEMIYIKDERIIFTPDKFEYDITVHQPVHLLGSEGFNLLFIG